ncbi:hypothetical protein [Flavisolibacter nicotianae]|uniref:hypothetical protein n=1 Tax=Flavisolibacter nicotianae TaxID=2364882 RepID=UPI000EAF8953|nr:hypothetical protein [Flavisolibacter nicotianae]
MKKTLVLLAFILAAATSFANPPIGEKVLKQFAAVFPAVDDAKWFEGENHYDVYFEKDKVKYHIRYDLNGKIVSTRNYYSGDKLCAFLKAKVAEKYPGKSIFGVTEITNSEEMFYILNLEDKKTWTTVRVDAIGQITQLDKMTKSGN